MWTIKKSPESWEECLVCTQNRDAVLRKSLSTTFFTDSDFCEGQACKYSGQDGIEFGGCLGRLQVSKAPLLLYDITTMRAIEHDNLSSEIDHRLKTILEIVKKNQDNDKQTILFASGREAGVLFAALTKNKNWEGLDVDIVFLESIPGVLTEKNPSTFSWKSFKSMLENSSTSTSAFTNSKDERDLQQIVLKERVDKFPTTISTGVICSHADGEDNVRESYEIINALTDAKHKKAHIIELHKSRRGDYTVHDFNDQFSYYWFVINMYSKYMGLPTHVKMLK